MKSFVSKLGLFVVVSAAVCSAQSSSLSACSGMSLGTNGSLNGFVPVSTDAWHTDVTNASVDANSATIINTAGDLASSYLHPDFGQSSGIPYNVVDSNSTTTVPVAINLYAADSDITVAPIPSSAVIEGQPSSCPTDQADRHLIVVDRNKCVVYEYWQAGQCNGAYSASNTALFDLSNGEKRPYGLTSADAAGLSIFEGLVRYDEIISGTINHAIRFTASHTKANANNGYFVAPATHAAGNNWGTNNIIGMRIRLKANFDISKYSATNQVILKAMKKYGMILADNGSNMFFQGTTDSRWDDDDLAKLKTIPSSAFDVVTMGTKYDANTAPTGAAPVVNSFTASSATVAAGTAVTLTANVTGSDYNYIDNAGFVRGTTVTVTPTKTTTYTLNSRNAYGATTKSVTVTVGAAPAIKPPTTPTTTVATKMQLLLTRLSGSTFMVTAVSNSPAPVKLQVIRGNAVLSSNIVTVKAAGTIMVQGSQAAGTGFTSALAVGQVTFTTVK